MKKLTTLEFIDRAKKIHGDKYDYDNTIYKGAGDKLSIICRIHGSYEIKPYNHLSGLGCPKCGLIKRSKTRTKDITYDEFLKKSLEKFGNLYTYEKMEYIDKNTKILVTCSLHGDFEILPWRFLTDKYPCPRCANNRKKPVDVFINEVKQKYGNKYDYSLVNYDGAMKLIQIICHLLDENNNEHGVFFTTPVDHLYGNGICPKCREKYKYNTESCIRKLKKLYGDKYDYSNVEYVNCNKPITLYCKKHGEFYKSPHLLFSDTSGVACPKCKKEIGSWYNKLLQQKAKESFIEKAKNTHGDKYDYSLSNYINAKTKVDIICKKHGIFLQIPNKHIGGENCPKCKESTLETHMRVSLEKNNIKYVLEKMFNWLGLLRLDFYLPDYNVAIECLGIQHFENTNFHNKSMFDGNIDMDLKKLNRCLENNVCILYYSENKYDTFLGKKVYHNTLEIISKIKSKKYE